MTNQKQMPPSLSLFLAVFVTVLVLKSNDDNAAFQAFTASIAALSWLLFYLSLDSKKP